MSKPTDYTDPTTIDVDEVITNINNDHRMRGHTWTGRLSWPNVTVKALADEITALRDLVRTVETTPTALTGVWVTYYPDGSGVIIFDTEIDALRHAVENSMQVRFWTVGSEFKEIVR